MTTGRINQIAIECKNERQNRADAPRSTPEKADRCAQRWLKFADSEPKTRDQASTHHGNHGCEAEQPGQTVDARIKRVEGSTHLRRRDKLLDADPRLIERAGTLRDSLSSHHTNRMLALSSAHAKGYLLRTRTPGLRHPAVTKML